MLRRAAVAALVPECILLLLAVSVLYLASVYQVLSRHTSGQSRLLMWILICASIFRFTIWPAAVPVTDDVHRYRWEAKLQTYGGNPYQVRPADPQWTQVRDSSFDRVGQKDFKAGYGPAWELLARWTYRALQRIVPETDRQIYWFRAVPAFFDASIIAALLALLKAQRMPLTFVLVYAWCPLPIWEFWANGHNDAPAVFFVVLAAWAAARKGWGRAFLWLGVATALKFWPVLLVPLFLRRSGRSFWMVCIVPIVLVVFAVPYWSGVSENAQFMTGFLGSWRNNDSLFGLVAWVVRDPYWTKYTTWALVLLSTIWIAFRPIPGTLERQIVSTLAVALLLSSNCHPWYLTWFTPFLAFVPNPGLLLWTSLMPLSYEVWIRWTLLGEWNGSTPHRWWIFGPVLAVLLACWIRRRVRGGLKPNAA